MIKFYPDTALDQLEFHKVKELLHRYCETVYAQEKLDGLRIHTQLNYIRQHLQITYEYKLLLESGQRLPVDFLRNISREIKLLSIPGAMLGGEQLLLLRQMLNTIERLFQWFATQERKDAFPALYSIISESYYEKQIRELIDEVIDELGAVKDNASEELQRIRTTLSRKRQELRRLFDRIVQRMNKQGYLADIEESFLNGRRVLAVFAENKRMIKGVLHGESDSRQTAFIEPEETTGLNNEVYSLEHEEQREVQRILRLLTQMLQPYAALMRQYLECIGEYDFAEAKGKLALDMNANLPQLVAEPHIEFKQARHPLLLLYNKSADKPTIPLDITLNAKERILVISGPNAGGKTVTMKTIGLCQLMLQAGLLVPMAPSSTMGVFKQLFIHIGDTQNLEFELSTYSSHLQHMKYFLEMANGKTLFFIDELGSGSDPNLGGAFAEVILEELARRHSMGVVTTHYLNLKVMANRVPGILNGAMQFDEEKLLPLYRLVTGKPGSSYTFSIAERIGLPKRLIEKARGLVDEEHFTLDKLLNRTEQDLQKLNEQEAALTKLTAQTERLKKELESGLNKERHRQQVELLKEQNRFREDQLTHLRELDRKLKAIVAGWRKAEDKMDAVRQIQLLLFPPKDRQARPMSKKATAKENAYTEVEESVAIGDLVKIKTNRQVGTVKELRGKKLIVQVGAIPITITATDAVKVVRNPAFDDSDLPTKN